jgi:uncharacterized membrane protein
MKTLLAMAVGAAPLLASGVVLAQTGSMMDGYGGMGGGWMAGYGGFWGPALLVVVVAAVVVWLVKQKHK